MTFVAGRYVLGEPIGQGGMSKIHVACSLGEQPPRVVAVKRMLGATTHDANMLADEARIVSRVRHPNVVAVVDVAVLPDAVLLVMEHVHGPPLSELLEAAASSGRRIPLPVVSRVLVDALHGLHAAHEAFDEHGASLEVVHRDVSPQNILVGADGVTRVADFGVAKARGKMVRTDTGTVRGKLAYVAPEQLATEPVDRRVDVHAAGIVLWEALTSMRMRPLRNEAGAMRRTLATILRGDVVPPSSLDAVPAEVEEVVLRALAREPEQRFPTTLAMASSLARACPPCPPREVAGWLAGVAGAMLARRSHAVLAVEERARALASLP